MTGHGIRTPRRRAALRALLTAALAVAGLAAWATSLAAQQPVDPLVLHRMDPEAQDLQMTVDLVDGSGGRHIDGRRLLAGSDEIYVRSASAAALFKASRFWQDAIRQLTFRVGDHAFVLTADSRLVILDQGETLLPVPVLALDGDLWLPMVSLVEVIGPGVGEAVVWDAENRRLRVGRARFNVTRLRLEALTRATAVHVYCEEPLSYRADASEPGYVVLKIYGGVVDPRSVGRSGRLGLVEHVESRQLRDHALVYVKVDELVDRYRTYTSEDGREIVLVVEEEQISALPSPTPRGRVNVMVEEAPVDVTRPIDVRTVVIDPGHGGVEVGRVGRSGVLEKDVNLAVARELQRYLQREGGLEVVLTREQDEQLGLAERAEIANRAGGDLFISLHCNGWFNEGATGIETYFLSPAKTDWTQQVAAEENRGLEDGGDDVSFIVWELVQNKFISASSDLAETVQATLCRELSGVNRGVRQAGFRVLVGAYMPAVLVEMGFLSNSSEEQRLDDGRYQRQLAKALGQAVLEFKERYARSAHLAGSDEE